MAGTTGTSSVPRESWGTRGAFIVAAISSAIGLGNIWRFPGVAYENGGGAFLLPYLIALFSAGLPILFLDYAIGHRYRASAPLAFRRIDRRFEPLGWWQVGVCFVIATYYAVVIAWAIAYTFYATTQAWGDDAIGFFVNNHVQSAEADAGFTMQFASSVLFPLIALWALAIFVLALGVRRGLDKVNKITLPMLVITFIGIVVYALTLPGAIDGFNAFFTPDWAALANPTVWIAAFGHIFFSFSVAFGIMLTYSSYLRRKSDLTGSGLVVAFANTGFELLAGIGVFATLGFLASVQNTTIDGLEQISGVALAFMTYPTLLSEMPGGLAVGVAFFLCLTLAGFSSLLSILQVVSAAFQDKFGMSHRRAGVFTGIATAIPSILLFATTSGLNTLDIVDAFINNIGVVASAVLTLVLVVLIGRKVPEFAKHLNAVSSFKVGRVWQAMLVVLTPIVLVVILVTGAFDYITNGYGSFPWWYVVMAGWGMLALLLVASFSLSYGRYGRIDADTAVPADTDALAREVEADLRRIRAEAERGKK
ncbi:MAG: sodium-dependent transporter [Ancrocorticia sp.]